MYFGEIGTLAKKSKLISKVIPINSQAYNCALSTMGAFFVYFIWLLSNSTNATDYMLHKKSDLLSKDFATTSYASHSHIKEYNKITATQIVLVKKV